MAMLTGQRNPNIAIWLDMCSIASPEYWSRVVVSQLTYLSMIRAKHIVTTTQPLSKCLIFSCPSPRFVIPALSNCPDLIHILCDLQISGLSKDASALDPTTRRQLGIVTLFHQTRPLCSYEPQTPRHLDPPAVFGHSTCLSEITESHSKQSQTRY